MGCRMFAEHLLQTLGKLPKGEPGLPREHLAGKRWCQDPGWGQGSSVGSLPVRRVCVCGGGWRVGGCVWWGCGEKPG